MTTNDSSELAFETAFPDAHILVVDDERTMRRTLTGLFERIGYRASEAASGQEALDYLSRHDVDLVILDLKMPGMDGAEVLEAARPTAPETVFIILTAYGTLESAIAGIRCGAFDYLLKPTSLKDIVRTVEAGLIERRRRVGPEDPVALLERALTHLKASEDPVEAAPPAERFLQVPPITVDVQRRLVVVRGDPVDLTPTEFDILAYMVRHRNRVVSCSELAAHLHGYDIDEVDERDARVLLRSHFHRLRHKVELNPSEPSLIKTVRGEGYILTTPEEWTSLPSL